MSAPNGGCAATLDLLRRMGRATSSQLAQKLGTAAADVVLSRLRKLEVDGKVSRVGTIATGHRPVVVWAPRPKNCADSVGIVAANSEEFIARGGIVERLESAYSPPTRYPVPKFIRGSGFQ